MRVKVKNLRGEVVMEQMINQTHFIDEKEGDSDIQYAWIDSGYCYKEDVVLISMLNHLGEF